MKRNNALLPNTRLGALAAIGCGILLTCATASAQVCLRQQQQRLTAAVPAEGDWFGAVVSIDTTRALIGTPRRDDACVDDSECNSGVAYIFRFDAGAWSEEAKLTGFDTDPLDQFGNAVAILGDLAVVGAPNHGNTGEPFVISGPGAVYVFRFDGENWPEESRLTAFDASAQTGFGISVSVANTKVLIGRPGAAFVFRTDGADWFDEARLTPSDSTTNFFARTVSLSGDVALIGAPTDDDLCPTVPQCDSGAAYVYRFNGDFWADETKLKPSDLEAGDTFGSSVSVSGNWAVIAAPRDDDACPADPDCNSGAAYVYRFDGKAWLEVAKLTAFDAAAGDLFGHSASIRGERLIVGAVDDDDAGTSSGSAYVFRRARGGTPFDPLDDRWLQEAKLTASDAQARDLLGRSVAIGGSFAVAGALGVDDSGNDSGATYVFAVGSACPNLEGFADFSNCFSGPASLRDPGCELHDLDTDLDVDLDDYGIFLLESDAP